MTTTQATTPGATALVIGHLVALATIIVWGVTFISTKILLEDFTPVEILVLRFLLGWLFFLYISIDMDLFLFHVFFYIHGLLQKESSVVARECKASSNAHPLRIPTSFDIERT